MKGSKKIPRLFGGSEHSFRALRVNCHSQDDMKYPVSGPWRNYKKQKHVYSSVHFCFNNNGLEEQQLKFFRKLSAVACCLLLSKKTPFLPLDRKKKGNSHNFVRLFFSRFHSKMLFKTKTRLNGALKKLLIYEATIFSFLNYFNILFNTFTYIWKYIAC